MSDSGKEVTSTIVAPTTSRTTAVTPIPITTIAPVTYRSHTNCLCCIRYKDGKHFKTILQSLDLTPVHKKIIQTRFLDIVENFQWRSHKYSLMFFLGHFIITVGSLFVPALLSIVNYSTGLASDCSTFNVEIYWATFVISILVTVFNGILTFYKVDKKYYFLNTTLERLRSEGWQYFGLTGRYSGHLIKYNKPTHENQFVFFTHYVEKIKMKQVEEEYYKADEKISQAPAGNISPTAAQNELYPLSPDQPMYGSLHNIPEPVQEAVNNLIKSHTVIDVLPNQPNPPYPAKRENSVNISNMPNVLRRSNESNVSDVTADASIVSKKNVVVIPEIDTTAPPQDEENFITSINTLSNTPRFRQMSSTNLAAMRQVSKS